MTVSADQYNEALSACRELMGALDPLDDLVDAASKSESATHLLIARVRRLKRDLDVNLAQLSAAIDATSEVSRVQNSSAKRFFVAEPATPADGFDLVENIWEAHHILSESHEIRHTFSTEEEANAECKRLNDDYDHRRARELELFTKRGPVSQENCIGLSETAAYKL